MKWNFLICSFFLCLHFNYITPRLLYRNETEINQQSDKMKLLDYDENYLAELKEEKETLSKNVKENSHILRLLENGKSSCKSFV